MEPLTAFFILEGLLFDAIGAIFVVSGILDNLKIEDFPEILRTNKNINFGKNLTKKLKNVAKEKMDIIKEKDDELLRISKFVEENDLDYKSEYDVEEGKIYVEKLKLNFENILESMVIETKFQIIGSFLLGLNERTKHNVKKVRIGLPFLIGGFLLQGIGVITQLII